MVDAENLLILQWLKGNLECKFPCLLNLPQQNNPPTTPKLCIEGRTDIFLSFIEVSWFTMFELQQSDLVIYINISIFFFRFFSDRLSQNFGWHSLCYTAGPYWPSIPNTIVFIFYFILLSFILFYCLFYFRVTPTAYAASHATGQIRAVAAGLHHSS